MASLNIRSGWAGRMEAALQELKQGNLDVRFLQDTKLMQGIHTRFWRRIRRLGDGGG